MNSNGKNPIDTETEEMLKSFVSEAFDSLDSNEPVVEHLRMENNSESVNGIFRVFHTLKGLSGFFEMYVINKVTHEAETLLDIMRKQNKPQTEETISVIYQTFDFLRDLLQRVSRDNTDISAEAEADDMIIVLKYAIQNVMENNDDSKTPNVENIVVKNDIELDFSVPDQSMSDDGDMEENAQANNNDPDLSEFVSNDMLDQYLTSANELLDTAENNLLSLEKNPNNQAVVAETFGVIHSLKGNSGFMGFSEIEEISVEMETVLDAIRSNDLDIDQSIISVLLSNCETIRNRIDSIANKAKQKDDADEPVVEEKPKNIENNIQNTTEEVINVANSSNTNTDIPDSQPVMESMENAEKTAAIAPPKTPSLATMQRKDIRVETTKIDKLFDLVGELITIETMVTSNPDLKGMEMPNFNKSANMLNKITRELQEITMSIRMMPLEGLFNKMKRLVRDVSIKMNKKVDLFVSGQDTEMDKNVIDEIADPLVHILRNAIDHGIENPEARAEAGKSETGRISLSARYEGNEILIVVEDDGAGINRDRVLSKAVAKGLVTGAPEKLTDKEVFQLVFEPGFSTAEKVTDISGRGVGMDVVKKNIEKLRGSIDIQSTLGKGSAFTLRIPLTLAIMEAMVIRIGESRFALPILAIRESFRTNLKNITKTMDGLEIVRIREEALPIIRLHEVFNKIPDSRDLSKGILMVIESRQKRVCLFADEIVGQQQAVIKGLSDYIGKVPGITGCMIIGDGGIGLIIDIESLIEMAEEFEVQIQ